MGELILIAISTYGVAALVSEYDGPFDIFLRLRSKVRALRCVACTAVWVAIPLATFSGVGLIEYLAVVGAVIVMDKLI